MPDPVAQRNALRAAMPGHRIESIRFQSPGADMSCSCGWRRTWEEREEGDVEAAWSEHRREHGARTR